MKVNSVKRLLFNVTQIFFPEDDEEEDEDNNEDDNDEINTEYLMESAGVRYLRTSC